MVTPESVKAGIEAGLACEHLEVIGDGQHFQAVIVSARVRRQEPRAAPPARLRGARRAHARGDPRAVDAHADAARSGKGRRLDKLRIAGGRPLRGEVRISGAKNAALPIMCAALLTDQPLRLANVPRLMDVSTMAKLLGADGRGDRAHGRRDRSYVRRSITNPTAPYELVKTMRASVLVLGPAARALRPRQGVAAGRLRHRPAPGRPARQGPAGDGRGDQHRARLHARGGEAPARRAHRDGHGHGHRHREPDDGRRAGRRRDAARERRARAGGGRPRALPRGDGREDRGRRHATSSASRASPRSAAPRTA